MRRFYSLEYVDTEGDLVIRHFMLTPEEANALVQQMIAIGVICTLCDLSSQSEVLPVMSEDENKIHGKIC